jgi:DNA-binding winged helix-turn-helix (wHTH) protein/TolB-like protein
MQTIRFGPFEVDPHTRELRKDGVRIKLENQPFEVLAALLERPGEVISRAEMEARIWGADTFVDFEKSLTKAVNKLRTALGDSATDPRYIETLSRRGYRFIGEIDTGPTNTAESPLPVEQPVRRGWKPTTIGAAVVFVLGVALILSTGSWRSRTGPAPRIESVVVLPFENLTGDPNTDFLADAAAGELSGYLARLGSVRVISRTSANRYKGAHRALPEIARELRVDGLVEGSVYRDGNITRVHVRLLHGASERQLWAKTYDDENAGPPRLQSRSVLNMAHELSARLTAEDTSRLVESRTVNAPAYESYLRGRYLLNRRGTNAITEAPAHFAQALREDPGFALAFSGLSDSYTLGYGAPRDFDKADQYARRALELDPNLAEAHVSMGIVDLCKFRLADAGRELGRGIELSPNYVTGRQFYTIWLMTMGRLVEALAESDRALEIDPFSLPVNAIRAYVLTQLRRYPQAIEQVEAISRLDPRSITARVNIPRIFWMQGHAAEALAEERRMAAMSNWEDWLRGQQDAEAIFARLGFRAACLESARIQESHLGRRTRRAAHLIGLQYAACGDEAKALEHLAIDLGKRGYENAMLLKSAPELDRLRSDVRFKDLLRRAGLNELL